MINYIKNILRKLFGKPSFDWKDDVREHIETMDEDLFWQIIQRTIDKSKGNRKIQLKALSKELIKLSEDDILGFHETFCDLETKAYKWDIWGVAYIIGGGCGDDGFTDFRYWLISLGRDVYYKVLENADDIVNFDFILDEDEGAGFESFGSVAYEVYEKKFNKRMPYCIKRQPPKPAGYLWEEDELDELFPRTAKKYDM